jgi:hypothetical protein
LNEKQFCHAHPVFLCFLRKKKHQGCWDVGNKNPQVDPNTTFLTDPLSLRVIEHRDHCKNDDGTAYEFIHFASLASDEEEESSCYSTQGRETVSLGLDGVNHPPHTDELESNLT